MKIKTVNRYRGNSVVRKKAEFSGMDKSFSLQILNEDREPHASLLWYLHKSSKKALPKRSTLPECMVLRDFSVYLFTREETGL